MSRMIDADALEELFREVIGGIAKKPEMNGNLEHMVRASAMVIEMIKDAPTIEERKTGRWLNDIRYSGWTCTNCHYHDGNKTDRYCPHCGARMEVKHE